MLDRLYFLGYNKYIKRKETNHNTDRGSLFQAGEAKEVRWIES